MTHILQPKKRDNLQQQKERHQKQKKKTPTT
jgi:hypothetical protein